LLGHPLFQGLGVRSARYQLSFTASLEEGP
jgi:hypothetical protein